MNIRHLEAFDNADLAEIYSFPSVTENSSQLPFLSANSVTSLFSNSDHYTLVIENNAKVVGHLTLFLSPKARHKHCAGLAIAVHPEHHGKGIATKLMHEAINQADNWLNLVRLELQVHADNTAAIALYQRMGFQLEGTKLLAAFKAVKYIDMLMMERIRTDYETV